MLFQRISLGALCGALLFHSRFILTYTDRSRLKNFTSAQRLGRRSSNVWSGATRSYATLRAHGEVAEWSKAHAWKVCIRQRIEGSNPSLSANLNPTVSASSAPTPKTARCLAGWHQFAIPCADIWPSRGQ